MKPTFDEYVWKNRLKILTKEQMQIDGLEMFAHDTRKENRRSLKEHIHSSMEFVYIVAGAQTYSMNNKSYAVIGNQVFITPTGIPHGTGEVVHGRCEIFWFRLEIPTEGSFLMLEKNTGAMLQKRLLELSYPIFSPPQPLKDIIEKSFERLSSEDFLARTEGCALLVQFLCEILKGDSEKRVLSEPISKAIEYIDAHIDEAITLDTLAETSMLSLSRFKNRFRKEVQITPREYINLRKIDCAKRLLTETNNTVTEIAFSLSFSSSSYFSDLFKKLVGCSPSDYRNKHTKNLME